MNTEENIRKYRKSVNKNGWMANLYRWTWGKEPKFVGFCPFFWSVWICVLIAPFSVTIKAFEFLGRLIFSFLPEMKVKECKTPQPTDSDIVVLYKTFQEYKAVYRTLRFSSYLMQESPYLDDYYNCLYWMEENEDWECYYPAAKQRVDAREKKRKFLEKRAESRKTFTDKIVKYTSWMVRPLAILAICAGGWYLYQFLFFVFSMFTWAGVWSFITHLFAAALIFVIGVLSSVAIIKSGHYIFDKLKNPEPENTDCENPVSSFLCKIFSSIGEAIAFCIETGKMMYKKECPLIEWSDKDGPITKK